MMKRLLLSVLAVILLSGCSGKSVSDASLEAMTFDYEELPMQIIRVGVLAPDTGPQGMIGKEIKQSVELAFEPIYYKIGNYKIELVYIDSESNPEKAVSAYEKAIVSDKIAVGFTGWNNIVSVACMEVSAQYKTPHFFSFASTKEIDDKIALDPEKYKYWIGKGWPDDSKLISGYVSTLEESIKKGLWAPRNKNIAVFKGSTTWSVSVTDALKEAFIEKGWSIVAEESFVETDTSFAQQVANIKAASPVLVMGVSGVPDATAKFISELDQANVPAMVIANGLGQASNWSELTGSSSNLAFDQIPLFTGDRAASFTKRFKEKNGYEPSPSIGGMAFDWSNYFIKVMQSTLQYYGSISSKTLMQCADEYVKTGRLTYKSGTVHSEYRYTADSFPDPEVGSQYFMFPVVQYNEGEMNVVWPFESKTADIQFKN